MCPKNIVKLWHSRGRTALNEIQVSEKCYFVVSFHQKFSSKLFAIRNADLHSKACKSDGLVKGAYSFKRRINHPKLAYVDEEENSLRVYFDLTTYSLYDTYHHWHHSISLWSQCSSFMYERSESGIHLMVLYL